MKTLSLLSSNLTKTEEILFINRAIKRIQLYKKMRIADKSTKEIEDSFTCMSCLTQVLNWINDPDGCILE